MAKSRNAAAALLCLALVGCGGREPQPEAQAPTPAADPAPAEPSAPPEAVLHEVVVEPAPSPHPGRIGYDVRAKAVLGANPCRARGVSASMIQARDGDVVHVRALLFDPEPQRDCPDPGEPVTIDVRIGIFELEASQQVVIENVDEAGRDLPAAGLLAG